ncbi:MAG: branched-chain amino acid ABC transporter permease [Nitrospinae bacterium]|nr:branched-chain amino acid ABC transporter permease [Nitrospinota bacterium]
MTLLPEIALQLLNGFVWGWILALLALGLTLVFGLLEVINIAHGVLYAYGAMLTWYVVAALGTFWLSLVLTPILIGILGMGVYVITVKPIESTPIATVIATFGLLFILQHVALLIFGRNPTSIPLPIDYNIPLFNRGYPAYRLFVAALAMASIVGLWLFLRRTEYGIWVRAVQQDRETAIAMGIPASKIYTLTFGLGSALAALGGVLAAPITAVQFNMGLDIIIDVFIVVIAGGLGSFGGTVVVAIFLRELEGLSSIFFTPVRAKALALLAMVIALLLRQEGFGGREG